MGILNDLKSIFFGVSSVAKSAKDKAADYIEEHGDDFIEKGKAMAETVGNKVTETAKSVKDKVVEKSNEYLDDFDLGDEVKEATDKMSNIGNTLKEKGEDLFEKFGEASEKVGSKILGKTQEITEKYGEKVSSTKDAMVDKANEVAGQMKDKFNETVKNAEAWEAEQKEKYQAGFPKEDFDASGSFLEGKDSFFEKADKFASGDYKGATEGKIDIENNPNPTNTVKPTGTAAGFEDMDNDGDEIIDDAIIEEES